MKKRWKQRWDFFRDYYLVLVPKEKKVIAFICAAFLLGLTTKCYRDKHPQPLPYVDFKHPRREKAMLPHSPTPRPHRSRKAHTSVTPTPTDE